MDAPRERPGMADVELLDEALRTPDPPAGRRRAASRRWRPAVLVAVGVLLVAVLVGSVVEHRARAERERMLAGHPGVVADLSAPPEVAWRMRGPVGGSLVGSVALLQEPFRTDTPLRAVDLRTGTDRWSLPRSGDGAVRTCTGEEGARSPEVVVCWLVDGTGVLVVDTTDGAVRARHPLQAPAFGHAVVGDDVVLVDRARTRATFRRVSLDSGEERWAASVEVGPPPPYRIYRTDVRVQHGVVVLEGATTAVLDAASGEVVGHWSAPDLRDVAVVTSLPGADVTVLPTGYAVWPDRDGPARSSRGTFHRADGGEVPLHGFVVEPEVTDGSAGHVLLVTDEEAEAGGLVGVHAATGAALWRSARTGDVLLRADGAVVLADDGGLVALDAVTGALLWRSPVPRLRADAGWLTDGEHLVVASLEQRTWTLVAVRLGDGAPVWRSPAPGPLGAGPDRLGGGGGLQAPDGVPVLVAPGELTALRP